MKLKFFMMACFLFGCGSLNLPSVGDINSIKIKLNEPLMPEYWNYDKIIDKKYWPEILALFKKERYFGPILKWQGLAVIEITLISGQSQTIAIFLTNEKKGCYRVGNKYYVIEDEKQFYRKIKNIINPE